MLYRHTVLLTRRPAPSIVMVYRLPHLKEPPVTTTEIARLLVRTTDERAGEFTSTPEIADAVAKARLVLNGQLADSGSLTATLFSAWGTVNGMVSVNH